jgi:hypothetical protein
MVFNLHLMQIIAPRKAFDGIAVRHLAAYDRDWCYKKEKELKSMTGAHSSGSKKKQKKDRRHGIIEPVRTKRNTV